MGKQNFFVMLCGKLAMERKTAIPFLVLFRNYVKNIRTWLERHFSFTGVRVFTDNQSSLTYGSTVVQDGFLLKLG